MKTRLATVAVVGALWALGAGLSAFSLSGSRWTAGSTIVMRLQMGASGGALSDGSADWDAVMDAAIGTWNSVLTGVAFRGQRDSTSGVALRNGVNNVAWADNAYGEPFGDAIAIATWTTRNGVMQEADVLFDRSRNWNSYRGGLRSSALDVRRVALHELGHVLGLSHPDEAGQSVAAVMNSRVSNIDNLTADDINGARSIYGGASAAPSAPAPAVNHAPSVSASCEPSCTVEAEQSARFRASGSDPDGDPLTYTWSIGEGRLENSSAADTAWRAPSSPGTLIATVTVRDNRGGTAIATLRIEVIPHDTLSANVRLTPGQSLLSANQRYRLAFQGDGNFVLYDEQEKKPLWANNTPGISPKEIGMQGDGNVVMYDVDGRARWSTGTVGNPGAYLLVQNDGNLVVYNAAGVPIWDRSRQSSSAARIAVRR